MRLNVPGLNGLAPFNFNNVRLYSVCLAYFCPALAEFSGIYDYNVIARGEKIYNRCFQTSGTR